jgi:hypothetical protein
MFAHEAVNHHGFSLYPALTKTSTTKLRAALLYKLLPNAKSEKEIFNNQYTFFIPQP